MFRPKRPSRRPSFIFGVIVVTAFCGRSFGGVTPVSSSTTTTINFEDQAVSDPSSLTSLTFGPGGLMTLTAPDPQAFGFQDLSALGIPGAESLGARSIQPDLYDQPAPFNVNFSRAVTSFSLDFADATDQTDLLTLKAFSGLNGTGKLLASQSGSLTSSLDKFSVKNLSVSGLGIQSVEFVGGPAGMNSAFYDNFSVTTTGTAAVPLPPAALLFPVGMLPALWAASKMRRSLLRNAA